MSRKEEHNICEAVYQLRDAIMAHNLNLSVYLSREIHERLLMMAKLKEPVNCELKGDE